MNSSVSQLKRKIDLSPEISLSNKKQKEDVSVRVRPLSQTQFKVPTIPKPLAGDTIRQTDISVINTHGRLNAGQPSPQAGSSWKVSDADLKAADTELRKRFVPLMARKKLATSFQPQLGGPIVNFPYRLYLHKTYKLNHHRAVFYKFST